MFKMRQVGKTLVNRTQGTRIASDGLKGRVYEVSFVDVLESMAYGTSIVRSAFLV